MSPDLVNLRVAPSQQYHVRTIDRITTHGRLSCDTMAVASELLPEPELPAIPMILVLAHGGE